MTGHERLLEGVVESPPFTLAADHRGIETAIGVELDRAHPDQASAVVGRLHVRGVTYEPVRVLVDKHLVRRGRLLETHRRLHGLAGRVRAIRVHVHENLSCPDTHAQLERRIPLCDELIPRCGQPVAHLDRSARSPEGIVFVNDRDSEDRQHRTAHRSLDRGPMTLEDR